MKKTTRIIGIIIAMLIAFCFAATGMAAEKATKEECVAKTKEAVKMFQEKGGEATFAKINDKKGPFVWKNTYVFAFEDETAKFLAHPYVARRMIGWSMKDWMDPTGKKVFLEFLAVAKDKGEGWVKYMHAKTAGEEPKPKSSYIYKVPGKNVIFGAGVYE